MMPYRIVLADDHVLVRQGVRRIIATDPDLEVVGEANDGLELLALLKEVPVRLVILDLSMPRLRGLEALHEIRVIAPDVDVIILTIHKEAEYVTAALAAGARGYLLKEDAEAQLFSAIKGVRAGGICLSPKLAHLCAEEWAEPSGDPAPQVDPLTIREREVLKLAAEGRSSKEIGRLLFISARTVEHHRANIFAKLGLGNTADLIRYAIRRGYL
ncbi:MAG: response regulator transcription factor [Deltaproteobacteria bacterium]|nr:response regulator transcription factor [Deltaproteobacteria bacterium]